LGEGGLLLGTDNFKRLRGRMRSLYGQYAGGQVAPAVLTQRIPIWLGRARQADTYRLRQRLFAESPVRQLERLGGARRLDG
jgi:hypothetical protein